jgi:replicative DNA helicase
MTEPTKKTAPPGDEHADLERALLAGLLYMPDRLFEVEDYVTPAMFKGLGRRRIYEAMISLHRRSSDVDMLSIQDEMQRIAGQAIPGLSVALATLTGFTSSGSHVLHHARLLRSRHVIDGVAEFSRKAIEDGAGVIPDEEHVGEYLEDLMTDLYGLTGTIASAKQDDLRSQVADAFKRLDARAGGVVGLRSGFYDLDDKLHGFRPGQLIVCGARPAMGKSAFGSSIVMNAAASDGHEFGRRARCALISLEMDTHQIITRMLASRGEVDGSRLFAGRMDTDERERIMDAVRDVSDLPIVIDDSPSMTVHRLRGRLRRIQQSQGLDLAVIDYIQLLRVGGRHESRQIEVSEISRSLKALARELGIPIIALCQLSRQVESRENKRPQLADLRESGSIEQDADVVMFLFREGYYKPDVADPSDATVIVAKNREGGTGEVKLHFRPGLTRFDNVEKPMFVKEMIPA